MPGIVGLITKMPREWAVEQLAKMLDALMHEPFYVSGTCVDEAASVYVGWVAHEGSSSAQMPILTEKADVSLVFSGEDFSDPATSRQLRERGHDLELDGPSYIAHLYEEEPSFPACLNGRFHGLLVDQKRKRTLLFNDRYGMHRLYFHRAGEIFYFAAEVKAILAVCPELRRLNDQSLGEFVACGAVLEQRTLFDGISVLPHASAWVFRGGSLTERGTYFHPKEWEHQEPLTTESYYRELRSVFTRNLPRYFKGHEQIGMSLTGGLDTRMILANCRPDPGTFPCYTFGSPLRENHDVRTARLVADACKQPFRVLTVENDFFANFLQYAERAIYLTDGCVDTGKSPDLYLNERARAIAPVRLAGTYGGEILRAVCAFKPAEPATGLFCREFLSEVHRAASTFAETKYSHPVSFAAFQQAPLFLYGVLALEETQLTMRSPYLDNDLVRTVYRSPVREFSSNNISFRLIVDGNRKLAAIPTDRGALASRGGFLNNLRCTALELQFKAEYAFDMGMPQWLAKVNYILSPLRLERIFLGRHKPIHFRAWYRDSLAKHIQDILLDQRALSRSYIERKALEFMVRAHLRGNRNYTNELHKVLGLEIFHRIFIDKNSSENVKNNGARQAISVA